ncbi:MAG: riboflavin biosynthesis protein RibF [Lachnospiraceae bacterium]|nr:riboflavin biosynthesis protein RibF [Lachnospiraceae bacterium]
MVHITDGNFEKKDRCIAFGDFDGIHKGHIAVVEKLVAAAKEKGLSATLISFDKDEVGEWPKRITVEDEKAYLLEKVGLDEFISCTCAQTLIDSEEFITDVLVGKLGAKVIVVGENDVRLASLKAKAEELGFELVICETVKLEGREITSEWARGALAASDFQRLIQLCGHPYIITGEVVYGKQLGRTVGMPTANISFKPNKFCPPDGVYATIFRYDGRVYKSMSNIGHRPTVDNFDYVTVEANVLDFSEDIYGKIVTLEVHILVRGVRKFKGLDEVKVQVGKDLESVRAYLDAVAM